MPWSVICIHNILWLSQASNCLGNVIRHWGFDNLTQLLESSKDNPWQFEVTVAYHDRFHMSNAVTYDTSTLDYFISQWLCIYRIETRWCALKWLVFLTSVPQVYTLSLFMTRWNVKNVFNIFLYFERFINGKNNSVSMYVYDTNRTQLLPYRLMTWWHKHQHASSWFSDNILSSPPRELVLDGFPPLCYFEYV